MDEVRQQNAALVEQAAAAAQSLEEQAISLKDAVAVFKVADTGQFASHVAIPQSKPRLPAPKVPRVRPTEPQKPKADRHAATVEDTGKADWETF
jgi:methyl-accepting chemotaxis protein